MAIMGMKRLIDGKTFVFARRARVLAVCVALVIASLTGCGQRASAPAGAGQPGGANAGAGRVTLRIASDPVPHAEILEFIKPELARQGVDLDIIILSGVAYTLANELTFEKQYDLNFFQHEPYLDSVKHEKGYDLVSAGKVHVEPLGFYSDKARSEAELPAKAVIAIPNDTTNEYRALKLLESHGYLKLKPAIKNYSATAQDVAEYVKPVTLKELESAQVMRIHDQFNGYVLNTNKVLESGGSPAAALFREGADSPYANILVTKASRVNEPAIVKLRQAINSPAVRKFILEKYKGAIIPAF